MGFHYVTATFAFALAIFGAPVSAQTTSSTGMTNMQTWQLIAIIVPSVVGGLTLLSAFIYCCCCRGGASMNAGGCGPGGCGGDCGCGPGGCGDCGCGPGCCDCNDYGRQHHTTHRTVYSSAQGPIQVQGAYNYRGGPPAITGFDPTYARNVPGPSQVYGGYSGAAYNSGPVMPRGGVYGAGPMVRGGGCGC